MDVSDPVLLKIIAAHPHLGEWDYRALETWWLMEAHPGEGVVEFLIRQGVFAKDAYRTIELLRKGTLTFADPRRIFGEQGHQRLRQYAQMTGFAQSRTVETPAPPKPAAAPQPGHDRLDGVRDWLARRAEAKQHQAPAPPSRSDDPSSAPFPPIGAYRTDPPSMPPQAVADATGALDSSRFPQVGDQYGKYFLTEELGRGAAAVVFRAFNRTLNNTVALKVLKLPRGSGPDSPLLKGLRSEAQLLARFNHPTLVRVFDLVEDVTYPFLVLEYVEGLTLVDLLGHAGRIRLDRAVKLIAAIAEGLAAAQRKIGLVHRDVKPGNILLARDGSIKLADLGLAVIAESQPITTTPLPGGTPVAGTAAYMAPEQCQGESVDHRADIYSLGATFYHAVVGDMPFRGKNRVEVMMKQTREQPIPPHHLVPGLDPAVSEVILHMMSKTPGERYQSYDDLLGDLNLLHIGSFSEIQLPPTPGSQIHEAPGH